MFRAASSSLRVDSERSLCKTVEDPQSGTFPSAHLEEDVRESPLTPRICVMQMFKADCTQQQEQNQGRCLQVSAFEIQTCAKVQI